MYSRLLRISTIVIATMLTACASELDTINENQALAKPLIDAIYEYKSDHSVFPEALQDLETIYLNEIPKTTSGDDFFYSNDSLNGFNLSFAERTGERESFGCGYSDKAQDWECGYGD